MNTRIGAWKYKYRALLKERNIKLVGTLTNRTDKIPHKCLVCSHVWRPLPSNILSTNCGCPECGLRSLATQRMNRCKIVYQAAFYKHEVEIFSDYLGAYIAASFKFVCGHTTELTPAALKRRNYKCPTCTTKKPKKLLNEPKKRFLKALASKGYVLLSPYMGTGEKHKVRCGSCDSIWYPRIHTITSGSGCPTCAISGTLSYKEISLQGRLFKVQGYEPQALILMHKKKVDLRKICFEKAKIINFTYAWKNTDRRYYPDFQLGKTIIEVKSTWTAGLLRKPTYKTDPSFANLKRKAEAVIDAGYKFKLLIIRKNRDATYSVARMPENWLNLKRTELISKLEWVLI